MEDVLVSVNCITYNHEEYISDAIESFLMQKTSFNYEILIGEDYSTDGTRKIVENYIQKYPNKIKLITSEMNIGAHKNLQNLYENSKGKYIALCEGDDYWTDPYKLQKQVEYLESHEQCSMCFHSVEIVKTDKTTTGKLFIPPYNKHNNIFTSEDIIMFRGRIIHFSSIVYPKKVLGYFPKWFMDACIGDLPLTLILSNRGYFYYINEIMSNYRSFVKNSAMQKLLAGDNHIEKFVIMRKAILDIYDNFNKYSKYKYSKTIDNAKSYIMAEILFKQAKIKELKSLKYREFYNSITIYDKVKLNARHYFPKIYSKLSQVNKQIKMLLYKSR